MSFVTSIKSAAAVAKAGRVGLVAQKYGPQLLLGTGVVGIVAASVLAAKATLDLEAVLDKHTESVNLIKTAADLPDSEVTPNQKKRDITLVHLRTAKDLGKLYALPVSIGIVSISMVVGAHGIQYKRSVAAVAAYKAVETRFMNYRARVAAEYGEEAEETMYRSYSSEPVVVDGATVNNITINGKGLDDTLYFFDKSNDNWKSSPEYNLMFVKCQETFANQLLQARGHVFLNDVLDDMGLKRTPEGAVLGWVLGPEKNNCIDFGITDMQSPSARITGNIDELAECIILDIKTDGVIWDLI